MKKFFLSAVTILAVSLGAKAQSGVDLQARAGVNFTNITGKAGGSSLDNYNIKTGFHAGIDVAIPLADEFYIQPGVLFSTKGSSIDAASDPKINLSYIEVPVSLMYKPALGTGRLLLGVGPYAGYAIGGKVKSDAGESDIDFGDNPGETKRFDFGANLAAGYEFTRNIFAQLNFQLGTANIQGAGDSDNSRKNTGFGLSLGYRF